MNNKYLIVASLLALSACGPHAFSPPGRTLPLETAAAVGAGNTGLQIEGGFSSELLGPTVVHGTARVRHGVGEHTDINVEGNFMYLADGDARVDVHRGIYSARFGFKHAFGDHFALNGGIAGGGSAGGGFISPDFGFIASYDNPYVVPFLSGRVVLSQPFAAREVQFVEDGMTSRLAPRFTYGYALATGVRIPVGPRAKPFRPAILLGVGVTHLFEGEDEAVFVGANLGFELVL